MFFGRLYFGTNPFHHNRFFFSFGRVATGHFPKRFGLKTAGPGLVFLGYLLRKTIFDWFAWLERIVEHWSTIQTGEIVQRVLYNSLFQIHPVARLLFTSSPLTESLEQEQAIYWENSSSSTVLTKLDAG